MLPNLPIPQGSGNTTTRNCVRLPGLSMSVVGRFHGLLAEEFLCKFIPVSACPVLCCACAVLGCPPDVP